MAGKDTRSSSPFGSYNEICTLKCILVMMFAREYNNSTYFTLQYFTLQQRTTVMHITLLEKDIKGLLLI